MQEATEPCGQLSCIILSGYGKLAVPNDPRQVREDESHPLLFLA